MPRPRISALVHTLNEGANLPFVLRTVRWCDEIVVVDMESDDQTVEVARAFTERIVSHPRSGYVEAARAFGVEQCGGDWVLIVDADELITPALARTLRNLSLRTELDVVWLPRRNFLYGRWLRHGAAWPDAFPRFFRRGALTFSDRIHGKPVPVAGARVLHLPATRQSCTGRSSLSCQTCARTSPTPKSRQPRPSQRAGASA